MLTAVAGMQQIAQRLLRLCFRAAHSPAKALAVDPVAQAPGIFAALKNAAVAVSASLCHHLSPFFEAWILCISSIPAALIFSIFSRHSAVIGGVWNSSASRAKPIASGSSDPGATTVSYTHLTLPTIYSV